MLNEASRMSYINKKPFIILGLFILGLVVLPVTVFLFQQRQNSQSQADKTVVLSFEPTSSTATPLQIPAGTTFTLDVYVEPGTSSVSYIKAEMLYDATKFESAGGFIPNQEVFSQVVESPMPTPGKIITTLSIGSDLSKAVTSKTKIGTIALRALSNVPANGTSVVSFGPETQALAVSTNSSFDENVIANTVPATITFNKPALVCGTSPTDVMLVIDKSGSMNDRAGSSGTKISNAKTAANNFIDILAQQTQNTVGLSTFANTGTLNSSLSSNFSSVKNQVTAISANGGTCIECGILKANADISIKKRQNIKNVVILLTDGKANFVEGNSREVSVSTAESRALTAAANGHTANSTIYFTIGLGNDVNSAFLTKLAENSGGQYYYSPTTDQLNGIYKQISEILAKGSITGSVFNDTNGNGQKDASEQGVPGWIVQLYSQSPTPQAITTDSTGSYSFTNLCNGNYTVRQVMQSGWKQTFPVTPKDYAIAITSGNASTDKNFGNNKGSRCSDGIDNDGNGFIDAKDSTCHTDGNPDNPSSYDPNKDGERGSNTCADSKDNNGNGLKDGADPICHVDGDPEKPYDPNLPEGALKADLVITNTQISYDGAANAPVCSTGLGIKVTFKNQGKVAVSQPFGVAANGVTASVSAGLAVNASETIFIAAPLTQPVKAQVDANNTIDEIDETNNQSSQTLPQPTMPIQCVTPTPTATPTPSPTPTPSASSTASLNLNLLLHGIGSGGDNANPTGNSLSNKNPLTPERKAIVSLFDVNNNLVATAEGKVVYSSESGSFRGIATSSATVLPGKYSIKVNTDYRLTRLVSGIQTIVTGQTFTLPVAELVAGDATKDNRLDIRDYNMLLDCYSDISAAAACDDAKKIATDGNDDGNVNQFDYNLFLREISTQPGE